MKIKGYQIAILTISACLLLATLFYLNMFFNKSAHKKILDKEFPPITKEQKLEGVVINKLVLEKNKPWFITLSNLKKYSTVKTYNEKYNLVEFLQEGDSIYKKSKCDTIFIYKDNKNEIFIID